MHGRKRRSIEKRIKGYKEAEKRHANRIGEKAGSFTQHKKILGRKESI